MKQTIKKTKMIALGLITLFSVVAYQPGYAAAAGGDKPVEIKFLGSFYEQPVILLHLNNTEAEEYVITIRDGANNILFSEKANEADFSRRYLLKIDEAESRSPDFKLKVEVKSASTNKTDTYTISRVFRQIEDVVVAKK
ncbi:MAG: hypothetical protein ABIR19_00670 [Ginsengibacter sp.]